MCNEEKLEFTGKLITVEGIDRAGKSTVIKKLPLLLNDCMVPIKICGECQSPLGPIIRDLIKKGGSTFLKTYFFATDRAWTFELECLPALKRGELVLWDRYVDSAIAYRTAELMRSKPCINIEFVERINAPFPKPDLVIYIDITVDTSLKRAELSGENTIL